jgi:hypothetical protein
MKKYDYFWIADVHGMYMLSDQIPSDGEMQAIKLGHNANPQRRPTYGTVTLYPDVAEYIMEIIRIEDEGMKDAWRLIGGTKEDKIPVIMNIFDKGLNGIANKIMEGFDFRLAKGISNGKIIIENYACNFDNVMVQSS